jgi:hypothetical protein
MPVEESERSHRETDGRRDDAWTIHCDIHLRMRDRHSTMCRDLRCGLLRPKESSFQLFYPKRSPDLKVLSESLLNEFACARA